MGILPLRRVRGDDVPRIRADRPDGNRGLLRTDFRSESLRLRRLGQRLAREHDLRSDPPPDGGRLGNIAFQDGSGLFPVQILLHRRRIDELESLGHQGFHDGGLGRTQVRLKIIVMTRSFPDVPLFDHHHHPRRVLPADQGPDSFEIVLQVRHLHQSPHRHLVEFLAPFPLADDIVLLDIPLRLAQDVVLDELEILHEGFRFDDQSQRLLQAIPQRIFDGVVPCMRHIAPDDRPQTCRDDFLRFGLNGNSLFLGKAHTAVEQSTK